MEIGDLLLDVTDDLFVVVFEFDGIWAQSKTKDDDDGAPVETMGTDKLVMINDSVKTTVEWWFDASRRSPRRDATINQ